MKYHVIIIPKNRKHHRDMDTVIFSFKTLQQVQEFVEIVMSSSNDSIICQILKVDGE